MQTQTLARFMHSLTAPRREGSAKQRCDDVGRNWHASESTGLFASKRQGWYWAFGWPCDNGDGTFTAGSIENQRHAPHTNKSQDLRAGEVRGEPQSRQTSLWKATT